MLEKDGKRNKEKKKVSDIRNFFSQKTTQQGAAVRRITENENKV